MDGVSCYGKHNSSILEDEDLADEIHLHLQGLGKYIKAQDIINYLAQPSVQAQLQTKKTISLCMAQNWMHRMQYQWKKEPKGMYSDGHKHDDVVDYRQMKFLLQWVLLDQWCQWWDKNGEEIPCSFIAAPDGKIVIIWRHDESIFYANDRCLTCWVHAKETAKLYTKGEGVSMMAADFVSPDYGWLRAKDFDVTDLLTQGRTIRHKRDHLGT
ncbi:hypothetical protein EV421DRAFT_1746614 [Armillaria borealis]|uniref:Uncharacterized protein n=1 Tax=Armillaria borealis TaxID=47425 RepID=A0AA39IC60_9AGAR|nr:hypothetical protein EV421DRAFT_1746614 [Armillaria borealis]